MIHSCLVHRPRKDYPAVGTASPPPIETTATVLAGFADRNANLFRRIGLPLGDPSAWVAFANGGPMALVRDLEMDRVRCAGRVETVHCPADFASRETPLSGDRETAVAQALARCLINHGATHVIGDRTLPLIFAWQIAAAGIEVLYDDELGVSDRRAKSADEIEALRRAQSVTEAVMRELCQMIATAAVDDQGRLQAGGQILTSERVKTHAAKRFLDHQFTMTHGAIVAGPPHAGDCHHSGSGPLATGVPIIIDLYPRDDASRYHGDCTRTVVHGKPTPDVLAMHAAVLRAKQSAESELRPGRRAERVHIAAESALLAAGYQIHRGEITDEPSIQHGTGHGIGLEVHEPILLDHGGDVMLDGEVFTVEPGLYGRRTGGVRVEDMLVVTHDGPLNLNELPTGLDWT